MYEGEEYFEEEKNLFPVLEVVLILRMIFTLVNKYGITKNLL